MPRGPRLDAPGSLHHVMVRGIERRKIFESDGDKEDFLPRLGKVIQEGQATCFAWVLIPNHAHILLRTGATPLAKMMRRLLTGYAVNFNLRHQRCGHLFQNRYKSLVCEEDVYLLELIRYIHLNCIRAGLVKGMDELDKYPWSGHSVLMGNQKRPWQAKEEVLLYFGQTEARARRKYRQFIQEGFSWGRREELAGKSLRGRKRKDGQEIAGSLDCRVLGSGAFVERVLAEEDKVVRERALLESKRVEVEELLNLIGKEFGVSKEEMIGGGQRQVITKARSIFCYLSSRQLGWTGKQLSQALHITPAAIHYAAVRGENLLRENSRLEEYLKHYLNNLTTSP
jgi:putative transposase